MENIKIFAASKSAESFTQEICDYLGVEIGKISSFKFKNDNNFVQLLETVRQKNGMSAFIVNGKMFDVGNVQSYKETFFEKSK